MFISTRQLLLCSFPQLSFPETRSPADDHPWLWIHPSEQRFIRLPPVICRVLAALQYHILVWAMCSSIQPLIDPEECEWQVGIRFEPVSALLIDSERLIGGKCGPLNLPWASGSPHTNFSLTRYKRDRLVSRYFYFYFFCVTAPKDAWTCRWFWGKWSESFQEGQFSFVASQFDFMERK